jgi:hypothetical protein
MLAWAWAVSIDKFTGRDRLGIFGLHLHKLERAAACAPGKKASFAYMQRSWRKTPTIA